MKLLLTSDGLSTSAINETFLSLLPKPPEACSAILLSSARTEQDFVYSLEAKKELTDLGIQDAIVFNLNDASFNLTDQYDVIYVCGGNTFRILDRMKKCGVYDVISSRSSDDSIVYVGVSAGSIIAGPNIRIAGHGSEADPNDIALTDFESFSFTHTSILPHFKPYLQSELDAFQKEVDYPVIALRDGEALLITGDEKRIIS